MAPEPIMYQDIQFRVVSDNGAKPGSRERAEIERGLQFVARVSTRRDIQVGDRLKFVDDAGSRVAIICSEDDDGGDDSTVIVVTEVTPRYPVKGAPKTIKDAVTQQMRKLERKGDTAEVMAARMALRAVAERDNGNDGPAK